MTKIEEESTVGCNNPRYNDIDFEFVIKDYFKGVLKKDVILKYNACHMVKLSYNKYNQFLKILNLFPDYSKKYRPEKYKEYINFIEENRDKISWYIENYKKLEKLFFSNLHYEKHKDIFY